MKQKVNMPRDVQYPRGFRLTKKTTFKETLMQKIGKRLRKPNVVINNGNLTPFRGAVIYQGDEGECVGAAVRRACQLNETIRYNRIREQSDQALYTFGRLQEYAGINPDLIPSITDSGSDPACVLLGAQKVGLLYADEWPGPGDPNHQRLLRDIEPPRRLVLEAWKRRGLLAFEQLFWTRGNLRNVCHSYMQGAYPVIMAINSNVLDSYMPGDIIEHMGVKEEADHMVTLLDSSNLEVARLDNWWDAARFGEFWGDQDKPTTVGTWRATWSALETGTLLAYAVHLRG